MGYLEIGQAEYYRNLGFATYVIPKSGVKSTLEFKAPGRADEIIELHVRVSNIDNTSLTLNMGIYPKGSEHLLTAIKDI